VSGDDPSQYQGNQRFAAKAIVSVIRWQRHIPAQSNRLAAKPSALTWGRRRNERLRSLEEIFLEMPIKEKQEPAHSLQSV
jgi:hypothetical protein